MQPARVLVERAALEGFRAVSQLTGRYICKSLNSWLALQAWHWCFIEACLFSGGLDVGCVLGSWSEASHGEDPTFLVNQRPRQIDVGFPS